MVEPREPGTGPRGPRRPVVESARTEAGGHTPREDRAGHSRLARLGGGYQQDTDCDSHVEADLVKDPA